MILWPLSLVYGAIARSSLVVHARLAEAQTLEWTVISVGNLTVGGTGKTPMVMARREIPWRWQAGRNSEPRVSRREWTSDEIELMKFRLQNRVSFGVGKKPFRRGRRLASQQPIDVFLLDDGFQHLQLARDLDILLMDASGRSPGRHCCQPGGFASR